jgi:hypothetical protein
VISNSKVDPIFYSTQEEKENLIQSYRNDILFFQFINDHKKLFELNSFEFADKGILFEQNICVLVI